MTVAGPTARAFVNEFGDGPLRTAEVFALAKRSIDMDLDQIEELLESPDPRIRLGAVSVMDFQARRRSTTPGRRRDLYELYLRRHDRIDDWSMVDRAAPWVVGGYLIDKPRDPLYDLARSPHWSERRTAITATWPFIREGQLDDTFGIAELLIDDPEHFVQTAVGGWVREAGKCDVGRLRSFLDRYAGRMPRTTLRMAIEHLDADERRHYRILRDRPHPGVRALTKQKGSVMEMKLELVPVPVKDIDRSMAFYTEKMGFALDVDVSPSPGVRVVQLTPPGSACSIVISTGLDELSDMTPGSIKGLHLVVNNIAEAREELLGRGVAVGELVPLGGGVTYAWMSDPDGNTLTLQQMDWRTGDAF